MLGMNIEMVENMAIVVVWNKSKYAYFNNGVPTTPGIRDDYGPTMWNMLSKA